MFPLRLGVRWFVAGVGFGLFVLSVSSVHGDDEQEAKKRLEYMQAALTNLEIKSSDLKAKALVVSDKPLLRYSDPTRGLDEKAPKNILLDAGVWRLGTEGRPTALIGIEMYQPPTGPRILSYEFLSLTETKFSLKHKTEDIRWDATASGLTLKELPEAPKAAATAAGRLTQMRQLVRRFGAKERFNKDLIDCRLLAQPIDRYTSEADKIVDGAIFALANGTNPEIGIMLETDGTHWKYGILRLTSAESLVTLDDKEVESYAQFRYDTKEGPYNGGWYKFEMK
jgi:hypothetical protein